MYRGKFTASSVGKRSQPEARPQPEELDLKAVLQEEKAEPAPAPKPRPAQRPASGSGRPAERPAAKKKAAKKGVRRHTLVFYSIYLLMIIAFVVAMILVVDMLDDFLVRYEAAQPDAKRAEVFENYFADPDWGRIHDLARPELGDYGAKEDYVAIMEARVGDQPLTCVEISMGLSDDKRFDIRLGDETVAYFVLTNGAAGMDIPEWELKEISAELPADSFSHTVTVQTTPGNLVTVNGQSLGEQHICRWTSTAVDQYLPEGLHGPSTVTYYLDGMLSEPTVAVTDPTGNALTLQVVDGVYTHDLGLAEVTDEQKTAFDNATKAYGRFMIADLSKGGLANYFTGSSYDNIIQAELVWMQDFSSYEFTKLELTEFCAYSDTYCSARVNRSVLVTRGNGTVKDYEINSTLFMEKLNGKWMVVQMTNADVQKGVEAVRLRFYQGDTHLDTLRVEQGEEMIEPPALEVPAGKQLVWCTQSVNDRGVTVLSPLFEVTDFGEIFLPEGYTLEPLDLYAAFVEPKEAE